MKIKEYYIFIGLLFAYAVLCVFFPFISKAVLKFLLFQALFLLFPGYFFTGFLVSHKLSKVQRLVFGYPAGMVAVFLLSWAGKLLNLRFLEAVILPFAIGGILCFAKDKDDGIADSQINIVPAVFLYCACIAVVFRMFILPSAPPSPGRLGLYYQDSLWTLGNTWAYIRGLPLQDARFIGIPLGYHILQNIFQATAFKFAKIDPFYLHFYIEPVFDWFIYVFVAYYGAIKIAKLRTGAGLLFCFLLFFTDSLVGPSIQSYVYANPISLFFGVPAFILFLFYVYSYFKGELRLDLLYVVVLYIYFSATKSVLGILIPASIGLYLIFKVQKKGLRLTDVLLVAGLFIGGIILKLTMFKDTVYDFYVAFDPAASRVYQFLHKADAFRAHINWLYPAYRFFSNIVRLLPSYLLNYSVLLFTSLLLIDKDFTRKIKEHSPALVYIFAFFLFSIAMASVFETLGAQPYYIMYSQVLFLYPGVLASEFVLSKKKALNTGLALIFLSLSIISFAKSFYPWVGSGWGSLPGAKRRVWDARSTVDYGEWAAMDWLKKNSSEKAVFFTDRRKFAHESWGIDLPRFCAYSALSGRQAFAEGYSEGITSKKALSLIEERWKLVVEFLTTGDDANRSMLLRRIKADYFIQSLRFDNKDFSGVRGLELAYENGSVRIFKIR